MPSVQDGPVSPRFAPLALEGGVTCTELSSLALSPEMRAALEHAPSGACVGWGIPFDVQRMVALIDQPVAVTFPAVQAGWLVFMHTSDLRPIPWNAEGFISPMRGRGQLNEHAANYVFVYADGSEEHMAVRRRHQLGAFQRMWGENCFEAVLHYKPWPMRADHEQKNPSWGRSQMRGEVDRFASWSNWLWAWQNPHPDKALIGIRFEPVSGAVIVSGIAYGEATQHPLRWEPRRKAVLALPAGEAFRPALDDSGQLAQIQLDLGQVISATPRTVYPQDAWDDSYNNELPEVSTQEILIEYTAHPDACFHLGDGRLVRVADVEQRNAILPLRPVAPATQSVALRVVDRSSGRPVAVKLHVHGEAGEYLAPNDRHRIPNPSWFEDYAPDFTHQGTHHCTYIPGETHIALPLGRVYVEISKGFEIRPVRQVIDVTPATEEIVIEIERVLPWRAKGWVSADTHVHFLSPMTALIEGAGEGVNVVNLLASQWGELMTNVGDFDGQSTWGSKEAGGEGEYLVRVGTENRQHLMGHISLLGYQGSIISPMTTGGPNESALGDPIAVLLTEWARQCHKQGGVVVLPHFPNPRAEHAATIVEGEVDAVEMTAWGNLYGGIDPYSLADWYRYLNCGYRVAAVGGTDKMASSTAVGAVRTYARIPASQEFTYGGWMNAVQRAETFVTYGPLLEFAVEGQPMGSRMALPRGGGTLDVAWEASSVTVPMSRIELIVNGEIRESVTVDAWRAAGSWPLKVGKSSWAALLVRGHYPDKPEIVAAHSSPVMVDVEGSRFLAAADAVTILEQIEGAWAYLDTVGTRAEDRAYKRMRLVLEGAHRKIHNALHEMGHFHEHTPVEDHAEHHG